MSVDRHLAGQHRQVWTELHGIGPEIRRNLELAAGLEPF